MQQRSGMISLASLPRISKPHEDKELSAEAIDHVLSQFSDYKEESTRSLAVKACLENDYALMIIKQIQAYQSIDLAAEIKAIANKPAEARIRLAPLMTVAEDKDNVSDTVEDDSVASEAATESSEDSELDSEATKAAAALATKKAAQKLQTEEISRELKAYDTICSDAVMSLNEILPNLLKILKLELSPLDKDFDEEKKYASIASCLKKLSEISSSYFGVVNYKFKSDESTKKSEKKPKTALEIYFNDLTIFAKKTPVAMKIVRELPSLQSRMGALPSLIFNKRFIVTSTRGKTTEKLLEDEVNAREKAIEAEKIKNQYQLTKKIASTLHKKEIDPDVKLDDDFEKTLANLVRPGCSIELEETKLMQVAHEYTERLSRSFETEYKLLTGDAGLTFGYTQQHCSIFGKEKKHTHCDLSENTVSFLGKETEITKQCAALFLTTAFTDFGEKIKTEFAKKHKITGGNMPRCISFVTVDYLSPTDGKTKSVCLVALSSGSDEKDGNESSGMKLEMDILRETRKKLKSSCKDVNFVIVSHTSDNFKQLIYDITESVATDPKLTYQTPSYKRRKCTEGIFLNALAKMRAMFGSEHVKITGIVNCRFYPFEKGVSYISDIEKSIKMPGSKVEDILRQLHSIVLRETNQKEMDGGKFDIIIIRLCDHCKQDKQAYLLILRTMTLAHNILASATGSFRNLKDLLTPIEEFVLDHMEGQEPASPAAAESKKADKKKDKNSSDTLRRGGPGATKS